MAQQDLIPFRRIVEMVRDFCSQRRSGTVFIVSEDNRMAQVHLDGGNIVALLCRGRHGQEAVAGMRTMQAGRLRFDESVRAVSHPEPVNTNEVLASLWAGAAAPAAPALVPPPAQPASSAAVSAVQAATLEKILIQYIGPMGEIVCADHLAQAGNLKALIAVLADEVPDKAQAALFTREANRMLGVD